MKKILYTTALIMPLAFIGCDENDSSPECALETQGKIRDYTGLDGCGLVVQTESETFEVANWAEINFVPEDGMELCFDYDVEEAWASICMVGEIITITDCQVLE